VGPNDGGGLGALGRDLVAHLAVDRWLVPGARNSAALPRGLTARVDVAHGDPGAEGLRAWAHGLDWVVFAEDPLFPGLVWRAREMGAAVACVPMWEWTHPRAEWLAGVDLMVCPTVCSFEQMLAWKRQFGFTWDLTHVPWPVDLARFAFRPRGVCRRFLFVNGRGGCVGRRGDGTATPYRRKGLDAVLGAAARLKGVPFLVRSQVPVEGPLPPNVEARPASAGNERLYDEGDVCVQPSRWEGIGLSLLECQAAGLPLVTTDAPPMNEFAPFRAVAADRVETVYLAGDRPVPSHVVGPDRLAEALGPLVGMDVSEASRAARSFVARSHGWRQAARLLNEALTRVPAGW
jgi:glycosyltransferase involved in cell wall biosynthesis